jgi:hypothetical protein
LNLTKDGILFIYAIDQNNHFYFNCFKLSANYDREINILNKELSKSRIESENFLIENKEIQSKTGHYVKDLKQKMYFFISKLNFLY